jgi:hypothetical protein
MGAPALVVATLPGLLAPVIAALLGACAVARTLDVDGGAAGGPDSGTVGADAGFDAGACPLQIDLCLPAAAAPSFSDPIQVVPSEALPQEITAQDANNNLDIAVHDCRLFVAFRTAPSHFASDKAMLYVMSTSDQKTWSFERRFFMGTDLREPRFLAWNGRLFLYFAVLGDNPADFEPKGMMVSEYEGPGKWSRPEYFYSEGFIPWRTKVISGVPYMIAYFGGENIYDENGKPIEVHWLTTKDGRNWEAVVPGQPVVLSGGMSETDFVFLDDGTLVSVSRNEAGTNGRWGSLVCRAEARALGVWQCKGDPKKYDSPLVFKHKNDAYLIGRRNVTESGYFDLGEIDSSYREKTPAEQSRAYAIDYWNTSKRTSLWRVDPEALTVSFVLDLPSKGDTSFAGLVPMCEGSYLVYNYTSPLGGPDLSWINGQTGRTVIYRTLLTLP